MSAPVTDRKTSTKVFSTTSSAAVRQIAVDSKPTSPAVVPISDFSVSYDKRFLSWSVFSSIGGKLRPVIFNIDMVSKLVEIVSKGTIAEAIHVRNIARVQKDWNNTVKFVVFVTSDTTPREFFAASRAERDQVCKLLALKEWHSEKALALVEAVGVEPILHGLILKRGKSGWATKYGVVLKGRLMIFRNANDPMPKFCVSLYTHTIQEGETRPNSIKLQSIQLHRDWEIALENESDFKAWMTALEDALPQAVPAELLSGRRTPTDDFVRERKMVDEVASAEFLDEYDEENIGLQAPDPFLAGAIEEEFADLSELLLQPVPIGDLSETVLFCWGKSPLVKEAKKEDDKEPTRFTLDRSRQVTGSSSSLFTVDANGKAYACGTGSLGLGAVEEASIPTLLSSLDHIKVFQVCASPVHTLILTEHRDVFAWGSDTQLTMHETAVTEPMIVNDLIGKNVNMISCSANHSMASAAGHLWTWGRRGPWLGLGEDFHKGEESLFGEVMELRGWNIQQICCGPQHSVILCATGQVFAFGVADNGRLGYGDCDNAWSPYLIKAPHTLKMAAIACGDAHTACITVDGQLYTFGDGSQSALGHVSDNNVNVPKLVASLEHIKFFKVRCFGSQTAAISQEGVLITFGRDPITGDVVKIPVMNMDLLNYRIFDIAAGPGFTSVVALPRPDDEKNQLPKDVIDASVYEKDEVEDVPGVFQEKLVTVEEETAYVSITVNNQDYEVPADATVKDACRYLGIDVPTLCHHPRLTPAGKCRVCVVQIWGEGMNLKLACSTKIKVGMKIWTNTPIVRAKAAAAMKKAFSKQKLSQAPVVTDEIEELVDWYGESLVDASGFAVTRDMSLCVDCSRCVRACDELQGMNILSTTGDEGQEEGLPPVITQGFLPLDDTECIACGQCSAFCPTGAITERDDIQQVLDAIAEGKTLVLQTAPATRVAVAECFGLEPGTIGTGRMVAAAKEAGFQFVFDTNFAADLCIMEEGTEFLKRLEAGGPFPMFTSCCPGWINLVEKLYPQWKDNLSTCRSPQMMLGPLIKTYWAEIMNLDPKDIFHVSMMPCTAKKDEIQRKQMWRTLDDGTVIKDVDIVFTTREFGRFLKIRGFDNVDSFMQLPDAPYDSPLGKSTGAGAIFGVSGGVMEAALRTAYELKTGNGLPRLDLQPCRGLPYMKEATIPVGPIKLKVAIVNSIRYTRELLEKLERKECDYHFIEVMCCPGGCIGGGGQPQSQDPEVLPKRMRGIYSIDELASIRKSHLNPEITDIYKNFLKEPNGHLSHDLLHTTYTDRSAAVKANLAEFSKDKEVVEVKGAEGSALILYGSQGGNAMSCANSLRDEILRLKMPVRCMPMRDYSVVELDDEKQVFFVVSTFGEGEFPDNAKAFWKKLSNPQLPKTMLAETKFAVCGLGSMDYKETFNEAAKLLDARLAELGGERLLDYVKCDDKSSGGFLDLFEPWKHEALGILGAAAEVRKHPNPPKYVVSMALRRGRQHPSKRPVPPGYKMCPLVESRVLTAPNYEREARQFDIDIGGSGLSYMTGDHCSILPRNDVGQVKSFLEWYGLDPETLITIAGVSTKDELPFPTTCAVSELFEQYIDLNAPPTRPFLAEFSLFCTDEAEKTKLTEIIDQSDNEKEKFGVYVKENTYESVLRSFPLTVENLPLEQLITIIPVIKPRAYSIASSNRSNPNTVQVSIVNFQWQTPETRTWRNGLCTKYLFDLKPDGTDYIAVKLHEGLLRFPSDPTKPMVMFGLGTGIGVFRGFIQERLALAAEGVQLGECHLWQACRHCDKDVVYHDEFTAAIKKGGLDKHHTAFSHDQKEFITIPYVMEHEPNRIWSIAQNEECEFYYCGPAFGIPQKIMSTIEQTAITTGKMTPKQAAAHCDLLKANYFVECFSA